MSSTFSRKFQNNCSLNLNSPEHYSVNWNFPEHYSLKFRNSRKTSRKFSIYIKKLFQNSVFPEPFPYWKWKKFSDHFRILTVTRNSDGNPIPDLSLKVSCTCMNCILSSSSSSLHPMSSMINSPWLSMPPRLKFS